MTTILELLGITKSKDTEGSQVPESPLDFVQRISNNVPNNSRDSKAETQIPENPYHNKDIQDYLSKGDFLQGVDLDFNDPIKFAQQLNQAMNTLAMTMYSVGAESINKADASILERIPAMVSTGVSSEAFQTQLLGLDALVANPAMLPLADKLVERIRQETPDVTNPQLLQAVTAGLEKTAPVVATATATGEPQVVETDWEAVFGNVSAPPIASPTPTE